MKSLFKTEEEDQSTSLEEHIPEGYQWNSGVRRIHKFVPSTALRLSSNWNAFQGQLLPAHSGKAKFMGW